MVRGLADFEALKTASLALRAAGTGSKWKGRKRCLCDWDL